VHIFPIHDRLLQRTAKEGLLGQKGVCLWLTGLSGAGKSTVAQHLEAELFAQGHLTQVLDGDNIRAGLNSNLTFSEADRVENIRRVAEVAKLFVHCGAITIVTFISPTAESRAMAKGIVGAEDFVEVFINASLEACEQRDVKGLYAKARRGEIPDFTGVSAPYECPQDPDVEVRTDLLSIGESVSRIVDYLRQAEILSDRSA
jgi:adenylylsulfate kinase